MHEQAYQIITVGIQAEQDTDSYIIDASLHGTVHGFRMIGIVALGASGMQLFVVFLVIGFLEKNICTDTGFLQAAVVLHGSGCDIDVYPADGTILVLDAVDGLNGLQNVLDRVVQGIFAGFQSQTLVSHVLQGNHFAANFFLSQLLAGNGFVLNVIRAVRTAVYAIVGQVEGSEHDNAVAIETLFDFPGERIDLFQELRVFAFQQYGCLPVVQALAGTCLFDEGTDQGSIIAVCLCIR